VGSAPAGFYLKGVGVTCHSLFVPFAKFMWRFYVVNVADVESLDWVSMI
jgi:hypothetical protein